MPTAIPGSSCAGAGCTDGGVARCACTGSTVAYAQPSARPAIEASVSKERGTLGRWRSDLSKSTFAGLAVAGVRFTEANVSSTPVRKDSFACEAIAADFCILDARLHELTHAQIGRACLRAEADTGGANSAGLARKVRGARLAEADVATQEARVTLAEAHADEAIATEPSSLGARAHTAPWIVPRGDADKALVAVGVIDTRIAKAGLRTRACEPKHAECERQRRESLKAFQHASERTTC